MHKTLSILGQVILFFAFLALFVGGSFLVLFHADPFGAPRWFLSHPTPATQRFFVPTGLFLMTLLYLIVLGIEAAMKRMRTAGLWTTLAYVLALIIGVLAHFGWVTT